MRRAGEELGIPEIPTLLHRYNKAEMAIIGVIKGVNYH